MWKFNCINASNFAYSMFASYTAIELGLHLQMV